MDGMPVASNVMDSIAEVSSLSDHKAIAWMVSIQFWSAFESESVAFRNQFRQEEIRSFCMRRHEKTMAGLPVIVSPYMKAGTAILLGPDGEILKILTLENLNA